jgi:Bacterial protein of unknown function (DUF899)
MDITFPGESAQYRAARDRLLEQEIELRRAMEAVAAARRRLPPGGIVPQDYVFHGQGPDGGPAEVRLSELFAPGKNSLVIYSMMFLRDSEGRPAGPSKRADRVAAAGAEPVPVVHRLPRPARRRRRARRPAHQPRGRRESADRAHPHLRRRTRLAALAAAVHGRDYL